MNKKPKVNPYLLFMQEMRQTRPGWANRGNHELQVLCDPLWRALAREEKDRYKMMKKDFKMADRMKLVEERKAEEAKMQPRSDAWLKFFSGVKTRVYVMDVLSISKVRVSPEKEIKKMQKFLSQDDLDLVQLNPDMVFVGLEAIARYSEDNSLYRCRVTDIQEDIAKVFYIDFGNEEDQPISGLFRMPSELIRLPALCVSLVVDKDMVDGNKYVNTKKNIDRVYNILNGSEKLYVSLNDRREATFFDNEIRIHFKLSKKKEKLITGFSLDTIEEDEEAEMDEIMESLQNEAVVEDEVHSSLQENQVIDDLECLLREEETKSPGFIKSCSDPGKGEPLAQLGGHLLLSESISFFNEHCVEANEDKNKNLLGGNSKCLNERKDENQNVDTCTVQDKIVEMSSKFKKNLLIEEMIETSEVDSAYQSNPTSPKSGGEEASSDDSSQVLSVSKAKSTCEEVSSRKGDEFHPRHSLPASLRFKSSAKLHIRRDKRKQKQLHGWSVGDPVIAMWTLDGVWRRGNIHEMDRGHAFVIASEEAGVKATRVLIQDLKPANMPMELLNCVEEELLGWSRGDGKARRMNC